MKVKEVNSVCCYSGIRKAITKDYVPPKVIFTKPRPNYLNTVPSCFEYNNEASRLDIFAEGMVLTSQIELYENQLHNSE